MKIFVLDTGGGVGLDFAIRCQLAGHTVRVYFKPAKHNNIGKGLVTRVQDWESQMKWADLIFMTDNTKYHRELDWYFEHKYPIFGTNPAGSDLELNRGLGQEVLKHCGIPVPPYQVFKSYEEGEAYIRSRPDARFVSKPMGDEDNKALTYVSHSGADMIYMLQRWKKTGGLKGSFMLQDFIGGIEMGVSGWFGPGGFNAAFEENFENKKLMNDDKGPNTGEMGTCTKYVHDSKLADMVLKPLSGALASIGFVGDCDINCIIDDEGTPWPLEFSTRPGWPAFYIQSALHLGDPAEWMLDLLQGRDTLRVSNKHAIGVVLTMPDFPYGKCPADEVEGVPIYGLNDSNFDNFRLGGLMMGRVPCMDGSNIIDQELFVSASDYLGVMVGMGRTVCQAHKQCYGLIDELEIPNSVMYRTDIGNKLKRQLPKIQAKGFAEEWEYE